MTTGAALRKLAHLVANGSLFWPAFNLLRRQADSGAETALAFIAGSFTTDASSEGVLALNGAEHFLRGRLFGVINSAEDRVNLVNDLYEWAVAADELTQDDAEAEFAAGIEDLARVLAEEGRYQ